MELLSHDHARAFAMNVGITSRAEWGEFAASGALPAGVPADPETAYAEFVSWRHWLGVLVCPVASLCCKEPPRLAAVPDGVCINCPRAVGARTGWRRHVARPFLASDAPCVCDVCYASQPDRKNNYTGVPAGRLPSDHGDLARLEDLTAFGRKLGGNRFQRHYYHEDKALRMCVVVRIRALSVLQYRRMLAYKHLCAIVVINPANPYESRTFRASPRSTCCRFCSL